MTKPVVLIVLDGWGLTPTDKGNAIAHAKTPTIEKLDKYYPHTALQASGISVGLPWGESGNSEVGHMTLGTGQVIYQSLPRITMAIKSGELFKNSGLLKAMGHAKKNNSSLHLMGLVGKGGVHSTVDHLYALLEMAKKEKVEKVFIHVFTDGRDSSPTSGADSIHELNTRLNVDKTGRIATVCGRYWAMDRNNNWDRIEKSYKAMLKGKGAQIADAEEYLRKSYSDDIFDEYIEPGVVCENGRPIGSIEDNDALIFFNFREDRARQMTKAFALPGFSKFPRVEIRNFYFVTMIQYEDNLPVEVAFAPIEIKSCLGRVLSENKFTQLRIAETEKFAHVTYFFNGGNEEPLKGEDRIIIPSKNVTTFDKCPQMSAEEITREVTEHIRKEKYDFILINFANSDIVGHTGNEKATITAVECVDKCLEKIIKEVLLKNGCLLITSDHGNAEETINVKTGETDTEHSTNPVPLWYITSDNHHDTPNTDKAIKTTGLLSDVAPTILAIFNLPKTESMTGESLLETLK